MALNPKWLDYEWQVVKHHAKKTGQTTWHNTVIPEEVYYASGYINDFNYHRKKRVLEYKKQRGDQLILQDVGIDFIAFDSDTNTYHPGQAKCYDSARLVLKELNTFLAQVFCHFKQPGFLYTTNTRMEQGLKESIAASGGMIRHEVLPYVDEEEHLRLSKEPDHPLRPYQIEAVQSVVQSEHKKHLLNLATGAGKTLIAGNILRQLDPEYVVCVAPLLVSVEQLHERISAFLVNRTHLVVDSDSGFTQPDLIDDFLKTKPKWVIYTTFKSFTGVVNHLKSFKLQDPFVVVDEIHNAINNLPLCDMCNETTNSLFLSATIPEELKERLKFHVAYSYGIAKAIEHKMAVDYEVLVPIVDDGNVPPELIQVCSFEDRHKIAMAMFLATGMLSKGKRRCIVYLASIEECRLFQTVISAVFKIYHGINAECFCLDCDTHIIRRKEILGEFSKAGSLNRIKILINVRILNEAVDIVSCDSILIGNAGHSTSSLTTVQRLGRALRIDPDNPTKKAALFLWTPDMNYDSAANCLKMLKEGDPTFHTKCKVIGSNYDTHQTAKVKEKISLETTRFSNHIQSRCVSILDIWYHRLEQLRKWVVNNNKTPSSSKSLKPEETQLAYWIYTQRRAYKSGTLSEERIKALNSLPYWSWGDIIRGSWEDSRDKFVRWVLKHNKAPTYRRCADEADPDAYQVGVWINNQRRAYKSGTLPEERVKALNALPYWSWGRANLWRESRNKLVQWVAKYNKTPSSSKTLNPEETQLAYWINTQRRAYNSGTLSEERIKALTALPYWRWTIYNSRM